MTGRKQLNLYKVNLYNGHCGIVAAVSQDSAEREARWASGNDNVRDVCAATVEDIEWIKAMGGRVPKGRVLSNG